MKTFHFALLLVASSYSALADEIGFDASKASFEYQIRGRTFRFQYSQEWPSSISLEQIRQIMTDSDLAPQFSRVLAKVVRSPQKDGSTQVASTASVFLFETTLRSNCREYFKEKDEKGRWVQTCELDSTDPVSRKVFERGRSSTTIDCNRVPQQPTVCTATSEGTPRPVTKLGVTLRSGERLAGSGCAELIYSLASLREYAINPTQGTKAAVETYSRSKLAELAGRLWEDNLEFSDPDYLKSHMLVIRGEVPSGDYSKKVVD